MASTATTQSPLLVPRGALEGKPAIPISRPVWIIGSRKGCHLHLVSEHVSQAHAVIINTGRGLFIKDLGSRTHTYVNRLPVQEVHLSDGDKLQIGTFKFYFRDPTANPGDKPPVAKPAVLKVSGESIPVPLDSRITLIGRRTNADIPLTEASVSSSHALVIDLDGEHYVRDLGSRTGTYLNGQKINRQAPLSIGDVIRIGDTELLYEAAGEAAPAAEDSAIALASDESAGPIAVAAASAMTEPQQPAVQDEALPLDLSYEELIKPAEPQPMEVSATATPVVEPEAPLPVEPEPVAEAPAVAEPAAEPIVEPAPKGARRGWKLWGTRQPDATPSPAPKAEAPPAAPVPVSEPLEMGEPPALSEIELPPIGATAPPTIDLTPADETPAPPTVDLGSDDLTPVEEPAPAAEAPAAEEPVLPLEPIDADSSDTAYAVEASPAAESAATKAASDEVTAGELELSETDEPHALDLEAAAETSPVATETEPPADEVFKDVDLDALAMDALNEPAAEPALPELSIEEPAVEEPKAVEDVSATLDLAAASPEPLAEPEVVPPPSLDLSQPEAPAAPAEEAAPELELPNVDEPVTPPAAEPPAKPEADLPPPLVTPIRIKPSTRRRKRGDDDEPPPPPRRRGPVRGPGGKFLSAAEAERLAQSEAAESSASADVTEVQAPEQSATTDASAEVLEPTEPTPESALNLAAEAPADEIPLPAEEPVPSDSVFGRAVEEAAQSASTGDLVDDAAAKPLSPLQQIAADATHFVETEPPHEAVEVEHPEETPEVIDHEDEPHAPAAADEVAAGELEMSAGSDEYAIDLSADAAEVEPPLELPAISEEPAPAAEAEPEASAELDLSADAPALEPEARLEESPLELPSDLNFDQTFAETESTSIAGEVAPPEPSATLSEVAEPTVLEPEPAAEVPPAPPAPPSGAAGLGFFGIVRDADTFLGGMPLQLPPLAPPPPTFGKVGVSFGESDKSNPYLAPPPPPLVIGADDDAEPPVAEALPVAPLAEPAGEPPLADVVEPPADYTASGAPLVEPEAPEAAAPAPKLPVPPRPRRNRLADYEKRFAKVDEDQALEAMLREQNQSKPEQGATASGFDGLTLGPSVRQTDVFSDAPAGSVPMATPVAAGDPFLADKQSSIDLAARNVEAGRIPPAAAVAGLTSAGEAPAADPFGAAAAPARTTERGRPPRQTLPAQAPDFNYTGPQRGPRWVSIRMLVAAMVVFMIGAGLAGFLLTPVYTSLQARLSFANLKDCSPFEQHKFRSEQQAVLTSETVRNQARKLLEVESPQTDAGMLSDPLAFDQLARDLEWPAGTNDMRLKVRSEDPDGDRKRLGVLLRAIYSENEHLKDVSAQKRAEFEKAQREVEELGNKLKDLTIRIRQAQDSLSDAPSPSLIAQVEQEAGQLSDAWQAAVEKVKQLKFDLEKLAPAGEAPGAAAPIDAAVVEGTGGDPEKDPTVVSTREEIKVLQADIARLKALSAEDAVDKARKALDDAVAAYQAELTKLQDGKGPEWQDFLAKAKKLQGMALQMTGDIIARQREEQEKLAAMKRKLEQELTERREKAFREDPELKKLNDEFRLATRQYNVASAEPSLAGEAARWREDVERAQNAIAIRRSKITDDPELTKRIAEVQQLMDDGQRSISNDRRTLEKGMAETLKEFLASGGSLYQKLNDANKAAAQSLADRASVMVNAHETYGQVINSIKSGDSDELRKKEADVQKLAAAVEHRIAELKDAERKNKTELERQAALGRIEKVRTELAAAEKEQADVATKWLAKQKELAELRNKALIAKAADDKLQENQKDQTALQATINAKVRELDEKRKTGVASITPEEIAPDAITTGATEDGRWKYALVSSMAVCGVFLVLIWLGGYHQPTSGPTHRPAIEPVGTPKEGGSADEDTVAV